MKRKYRTRPRRRREQVDDEGEMKYNESQHQQGTPDALSSSNVMTSSETKESTYVSDEESELEDGEVAVPTRT